MFLKRYLHIECIHLKPGGSFFSMWSLHISQCREKLENGIWQKQPLWLRGSQLISPYFPWLSNHLLQKGRAGLWRQNYCINLRRGCAFWAKFLLLILINSEIKNSLKLYQPFNGIRRSMIWSASFFSSSWCYFPGEILWTGLKFSFRSTDSQ